jgi:uncharacterized protein
MRFVWDSDKNRHNIHKHGIDFADVPGMFNHPMLATVDNRINYGEERWVGIGFLKSIIVVVVFTDDDDKETIRLISARKATQYERIRFKEKIGN